VNVLSAQYALFVLGAVASYWVIPRSWRAAHLCLASLAFMAVVGLDAVLLLLVAGASAYVAGLGVRRGWRHGRNLAKASVALSVAVFFVGKVIGALTIDFNFLDSTILPLGYSFYTFQTIAYVVEVLRGSIEAEENPVRLGAYIAFFPHLTAGPVLAPHRMLPQFGAHLEEPDGPELAEGVELILLGTFKKVVLADFAIQMAITVDRSDSTQTLIFYLLLPLAGFFDISGLLDIARGIGKLFAIDLPRSFAQPLTRARSITDYWRRWQIPLFAWFREYVYRPVSERLAPPLAVPGGILATFLVAALWHAVSWDWLVWGGLTAVAVLADRLVQNHLVRTSRRPTTARVWRAGRRISVYVYVFGTQWVVSQTLGISDLLVATGGRPVPTADFGWTLGLLVGALLLLDGYEHHRMVDRRPLQPHVVRGLAWGVALVGIVVFWGASGFRPFVYEGF
jgi:D-alanyl-lipoteichoic acid acyltransferase DltB (MBOAT superfamily)